MRTSSHGWGLFRRGATLVATAGLVGGLGLAHLGAAGAAPVVRAAFGKVSAVNGSTTAGTCGDAGLAGTFTLATHNGNRDVVVATTTKFVAPQAASPSFANVCVGGLAGAVGTLSGSTLNARLVVVPPPLHREAQGIVASVNGNTTPGTCGDAGLPGTFTLTTRTGTQDVAVTASTKFLKPPPTASSFANVCVNGLAVAVGPASGSTLNARLVITIAHPPVPAAWAAFGKVASVNGNSTAGTCGDAGLAGTFTLATRNGNRDVAVATTTKFVAPQAASPSFANVCVGRLVGAVGTLSGSTLNARLVVVPPPLPREAQGIVASVNGNTTPGTCGDAGLAGTFTLTTRTGTQDVAVTASTKFLKPPPTASSFANVCVNGFAVAVGPVSGSTLNAKLVITIARGP